jgi:hypothetical protein
MRPAVLAALVLLVERIVLALPQALLLLRGELERSELAAAGDELSLAALAFVVAATVMERPVPRATVAGAVAFAGVELTVLARLTASALPRAVQGLPILVGAERVAAAGMLLVVIAATGVARLVLDATRSARAASARTDPEASGRVLTQ